ncbi:MAG: hypothetical protein KC422_01260 [Trueperaceae bacterium]|nr:hypothetical protein [Trueperaceae bacterium]
MRKLSLILIFAFLSLLLVSAQDENIWLYGGGVYKPGEGIQLEYRVPPLARAELSLYRIGNPEKLLALGGPRDFQESDELERSLVNSYSVRNAQDEYWGTISLGTLSAGLYFAQLERGSSKSATLILVSDLSMVVKSDEDSVLTYTASDDGQPRKAKVYLLNTAKKTLYAEGLANDDGLTEFNKDTTDELIAAAKYGNAWAFSSSYWSSWGLQKSSIYLQTDRPLYRPGHLVYVKGTARSTTKLRPLVGQSVELVITDPDGTELLKDRLETDAFGSFTSELQLPASSPLGYYSISASLDGETSYSSFEVQEFQKPEYRVTVSSEKDTAIQQDSAHFTVSAEYLFGGAVKGAQVNYAVMREPYYRWYPYYYDIAPYYGGDVLEEGEATLDENGKLELDIPLPGFETDYRLTVQARVTDAARREISASSSIKVFRSNIVLNIKTERYAYKVGENGLVTIEAEDIDGNPVSVPFTVETERYVWENGSSRTLKGQVYRGSTSAEGQATLTVPFDNQGSYSLTVRAADTEGRETSATDSAWVSGNSYWYWAYDGLSLRADKPSYNVGDTARVVIQSPVADAYVLITYEGQRLGNYELLKLNGSVLTYEFTITEEMSPNTYLGVSLIGDGSSYYDTLNLNVPPSNKYLNVEITSDADTYKPGETGQFDIRVSDVTGQGLETQLTLGLVDEGIYLLREDGTPNIKDFFYAQRSNVVGTDLSDWFYFGSVAPVADAGYNLTTAAPMAAREAMDEAVFSQAKSSFAPADVREDFRDTILWLPALETNSQGLAQAEVSFPDNLTEWRLTARAISLEDQVGQNTYAVKTTLPLIARLAKPRFLINGDSSEFRVIAQSNLETDTTAQLELTAEGIDISGSAQTLPLAAGDSVHQDFTVNASHTGVASVTATALSSEASDALKLPLPVLPHGIRSDIAWAASGTSSWTFNLPESTDLNSAAGTLYLTPSLAAAVSPALSYLAGYPYGCTEQTMSRFYPSVLAKSAGNLAMLPEEVASNLDDMVAKGLERIYSFQHDDGGWGFWQYDSSNPFITAYVVNGLLDAEAQSYRIRDYVLDSALSYLESIIHSESFDDYRLVEADAKAYAYLALARAGRGVSGLTQVVDSGDMSAYGFALASLAFYQYGELELAEKTLDALLGKAKESNSLVYWDSEAPRYYWNDDSLETTAYALEALVSLRPDAPIIPKVVNYLLLERDGSYWHSTKETAAIVKAALKLAEVTGEVTSESEVSVLLNGQQIYQGSMSGQSEDGVAIDLSQLKLGDNTLDVSVSGEGTLYLSANTHYVAEQANYSPEMENFRIKRTYEVLSSRLDRETNTYVYDRKLELSKVQEGDYILVTVEITPEDNYRYVMVNDPLPAGFSVVEDDSVFRIAGVEPRYGYDYYGWNYWYDGREVHDERVDFYFTYLADPVTFTYILRAETPGSYAALPTQAWLMYEPDIKGIGNDTVLNIQTNP